ncbi:hypothetical protein HYY69_06830 [Candidatus Woesearchaeota archaeon]|nr:hypothetical protein [Candidatus Woesearchaeota archaeon]
MHPSIEIVDIETRKQRLFRFIKRGPILAAIILDVVDMIAANFAYFNLSWDIVSYILLYRVLHNKYLANIMIIEFFLTSDSVLGQIDAIIPLAIIIALVDHVLNTYTIESFCRM